eukprot:4343645-Lingulodinium_polyedra.AAC.1
MADLVHSGKGFSFNLKSIFKGSHEDFERRCVASELPVSSSATPPPLQDSSPVGKAAIQCEKLHCEQAATCENVEGGAVT